MPSRHITQRYDRVENHTDLPEITIKHPRRKISMLVLVRRPDHLLQRSTPRLRPSRPGARRLPPPLNIGFLPLPVDPISKAMTHPLRSTGITPLQHYYEAVRPSPAHQYF